jgi:hypothetical protein
MGARYDLGSFPSIQRTEEIEEMDLQQIDCMTVELCVSRNSQL